MKRYYPLIDLLRFFAAINVVFLHYFYTNPSSPYLINWARFGGLGVQLFFIISGFVIAQSVSTAGIKNFFIARFVRLFPIFWISCTATYIFTLLIPNGHPVLFKEYFMSMTMWGGVLIKIFDGTRTVEGVYWTLILELIFYIAIGLFVYMFQWKNIRYFTFLWMAASFYLFIEGYGRAYFSEILLVHHASYFIFGITLSLIENHNYTTLRNKIYDMFFLVAVSTISVYMSYDIFTPYKNNDLTYTHNVEILHPIFFIIVILFVYFSKYIKTQKYFKIMTILGGMTYPLYLIHNTIGISIVDIFSKYGNFFWRVWIVFFLILTASYYAYLCDKKIRKAILPKLLKAEN